MNIPPYHVTYCTNVHAGHDWATMLDNLRTYTPSVKKAISPGGPMGVGLWLSNTASEQLSESGRLRGCKEWLEEQNLYVFTLNGFPYGTFHGATVKDQVYTPDWTTRERVDYTKRLFDQLAELLPTPAGSVPGGISTCPISYRHWFSKSADLDRACHAATEHLLEVTEHLIELCAKTGHHLHLDIEPEPDGILENSREVIDFFNDYLLPIGVPLLAKKYNWTEREARAAILSHLQVCYDVCHFALAYEEPADTFTSFADHGIKVGKIQVSSALRILLDGKADAAVWKELERFVEPTYLHQVTQEIDGRVTTYPDLPSAIAAKPEGRELRAHFHVPIFLEQFGRLHATQGHILKVLHYLEDHPVTQHLEVETYTWDVLPTEYKEDLTESIVREMEWFQQKLITVCAKPSSSMS